MMDEYVAMKREVIQLKGQILGREMNYEKIERPS